MISAIVVQLQVLYILVAQMCGMHLIGEIQVVQLVIHLLVMEKQHLILEIVRPKE